MIYLPTSYFPPISWLALLYQNKEICIDLWESYPKQTYRNRCRIATSSGVMDLSIPVKKPSGNQSKTIEIQFDTNQNWRQQHWRSIKNAYQSTPFFIHYEDEVRDVIQTEYKFLWELNDAIIKLLCHAIDIDIQINYSDDFMEVEEFLDYRFKIHPKQDDIIDLPPYYQVFADKTGFIGGLSSLDLLFNLGPEALLYLDKLPIIQSFKQ